MLLVPINIGGVPCVKIEVSELEIKEIKETKLLVFEKSLIEGDVTIEPECDLLFMVFTPYRISLGISVKRRQKTESSRMGRTFLPSDD